MKWIRWVDTIVAVFVVALVAIARAPSVGANITASGANCGSVACGSGFNGSYHDFVNGPGAAHEGTVNLNGTQTKVGQCTMCHSPHSAILTSLLWNHHLSNNSNFTWDINATMAGTPFANISNTWNGSTTKCLSCHDGSVAVSTINWFEGQTPIPGTPSCTGTTLASCSHAPVAGFMGNMADTHPVAMPYPCGQTANTYDGVTNGNIVPGDWVSAPAAPIEIYNNPSGGNVNRQPQGGCTGTTNGIECGSCHDAHNGKGSVYDIDLLRGLVNGSAANGYVCGECHAK